MDAGKPIRVLIVDDHALLRETIATLLSHHTDIEVCALAINGRQAVEQFRQDQSDVVLIDITMLSMDGAATIRAIREEHSDACIIAMTTFAEDWIMAQALTSGATAFWGKTQPFAELVALIYHHARVC